MILRVLFIQTTQAVIEKKITKVSKVVEVIFVDIVFECVIKE